MQCPAQTVLLHQFLNTLALTMIATAPSTTPTSTDTFPLKGTDHLEFYVGNAKQSAHYYKTAWGFQSVAYAGLETGVKDRTSYVLQQDKIRLVLTTPMTPDSPINAHLAKHGDGVKVIALWVPDAKKGERLMVLTTLSAEQLPEVLRQLGARGLPASRTEAGPPEKITAFGLKPAAMTASARL